ncbi:hypothetical protein FNH13_08255 [Ornithinimicrobium ciconiae]|uniref:Protein kinase domain-containing protein n=1 Tax=Ornithinimicrobium ciconiae TaxID=2594265 RepID=A0A516G9X7_9MICO|nr:hypothetical protein [Ornithinimicrobium ciconiae]QDO88334.1 hypothetical protein FNH13_08255 [Ornithinimicrobium ciconiae]
MSEQSIVALMSSGVPLRSQATVAVGRAVAHQLVAAHDQGIAHGDVGPHTVFVTVSEHNEVGAVTLAGPHPQERPSNWPAAPEHGVRAPQPPEDVYSLGQLMRALDGYTGRNTTSGPSSALPLIVTSMIADDASRRPTLQHVLEALGEAPPSDPGPLTMPLPVAASMAPASVPPAAASAHDTAPVAPAAAMTASSSQPPHSGARRAPVVLGLVGALVVAAAAGGTYWWLNQPEDTPTTFHSAGGREDLLGSEDGAVADEAALTDEEPAPVEPAVQPTPTNDSEPLAEAPLADSPDTGSGASGSSSGHQASDGTGAGSSDTGSSDSGGSGSGSSGTTPGTTPAPPGGSSTNPAPGTDAAAFDSAYCRDRGSFVALADTDSFRAIICDSYGSLTYHGLNRGDGLTITTPAVATSYGWSGVVDGGGSYDVSSGEVRVMQGSTVLASEPVHTFVDSSDFGSFRPGDLDVSQQISYPDCDGAGVVVIDSFVGSDVADQVQASLDAHPGSAYLRTDLSCDNFNRPSASTGAANIYATYHWVGYDTDSVCEVAESVGGYGYWLRDGVESGNTIDCS